MVFRTLVSVVVLLLMTPSAFAWNGLGHMEVAAIAWERLTPAARDQAGKLLALNPLYEKWIDNVAPIDRDRIAFIKASQWADVIKRLSPYQPDGLPGSNGNRPIPGPEASRNIGYGDHLQHKYWHFIDVPFSPDNTTLHTPDIPNVQTQIVLLRAALADKRTSSDIRSYDLVWLIHLIGDVHQPLHAAARFTREHPEGDQGGNLVAVECGQGCTSIKNLHSFWDGVMGANNSAEFGAQAAAHLPRIELAEAAAGDEAAWIAESVTLAQEVVYRGIPAETRGAPIRLSADYKAAARTAAERQIALAGSRLAYVINQALQ